MNKLTRRIISVMFLAVVVYGVFFVYNGAPKVAAALRDFAWSTFAAACGLAFLNYVIRFFKWEYYLAKLEIRGVPKGESFLTFLSGFVLTVTPGKVGEVFKSLILFQLRGVPIQKSAPIVVAERVTDLIGVIVLISIGSMSLPGGGVWASIGAVVVLALLVLVASPTLSARALLLVPRFGAFGRRIAPKIDDALHQLRELTTPRRLILPTLLSIVAWSLEGIALWVILGGFHERPPISLTVTVFIYSTATLAGALVPLPGGLGVAEGLLKGQMATLGGVPDPIATAAMFLVRFATLWFAVLVGFCALGLLRARNPALSADPDPPRAPEGGALPAAPEKTP